MNELVAIISLGVSVATTVVAVTAVIVQMRSNVKALQGFEEKQAGKDEKTSNDLKELLVLIKSFISEQNVINKTVSSALTGTLDKIDSVERHVREVESRSGETEHKTIEATMMIGLFADLLKRKGCVFDTEAPSASDRLRQIERLQGREGEQ